MHLDLTPARGSGCYLLGASLLTCASLKDPSGIPEVSRSWPGVERKQSTATMQLLNCPPAEGLVLSQEGVLHQCRGVLSSQRTPSNGTHQAQQGETVPQMHANERPQLQIRPHLVQWRWTQRWAWRGPPTGAAEWSCRCHSCHVSSPCCWQEGPGRHWSAKLSQPLPCTAILSWQFLGGGQHSSTSSAIVASL